MNCKECKDQLTEYLSAVPSKWREQFITVLCQIKEDKQNPECDVVKDCETVTTLTDFTVEQTTAVTTYTDENGVSYIRRFNVALILDNLMNQLDPGCLMSEEDWLNASYLTKFQTLIDSHCDCCE